jgi:DNA repair exonuclease SbcCD ATPase subunit
MNVSNAHLEFIEGINLIQGIVGSGKSAVFAALAYALSDYRRGDSWKEYVKTGEKFFEITLIYTFANDTNSPLILCIRGDAGRASVSKEASYKGITYKNSEADQFLESKFDLDIMSKVIFNLQGKQPLALMTPAERRDIFKKLFNSDFIDIVNRIKSDKEEAQKIIEARKTEIGIIKNSEYPFFRIIAVDESELTQLQEELKQAHLTEYLYEKLDMYTDKLNQLNSIQSKINKANNNIDDYKLGLADISKRIEELQNQSKRADPKVTILQAELDNNNELKQKEEATLALYSSNHNLEEYHLDIDAYKEKLAIVQSEIAINKKYLHTYEKGMCPECGQKCDIKETEEFTKQIAHWEKEKKEIEKDIEDKKNQISTYNLEVKTFSDNIRMYELKIKSAEAELRGIVAGITEDKNTISNLNESCKIKTQQMQQEEENAAQLSLDMTKVQKWIETNPKPELKEENSKSVKDIQAAIDDIQKRIQSNITKAEMNEKSKKAKEKDENTIINLNLEVNALESKVNNLNMVSQIYTIDFPSFINMRACKLLESHMNSFFITTKDHFEVALQSDKKGISFYYKSNLEPEWRSLRMVSGFESALSTLGFNVSVARAFGSDMIFLDEPEANADPQTAEKLFETIASIGGFKQLFVITHKENVLPILRYQGAKIYKVKGGVFENNIDY